MTAGILFALAAGLAWGLVFVAPLMLPEYSPLSLTIGRYLAFGLVALVAWPRDRASVATLTRADWIEATRLSLVGNFLYYAALAASLQLAGGTLPSLIIATLPIVIPICANLGAREMAWSRLAPSLALILVGILLVNRLDAPRADWPLGLTFAIIALGAWTWYPIRNARWLKRNPRVPASAWATAQGIVTLPIALAGALIWMVATGNGPIAALGARPAEFVGLVLTIGLVSSWIGTLFWNAASARLPTTLAGQLLVFEALAALGFNYAWRGEWPSAGVLVGVLLLVAGVVVGVRRFQSITAATN